MKTKWHCEKCGSIGEVEHDEHAGVWEVVTLINDDHYQTNRFCEWDVNKVKVI